MMAGMALHLKGAKVYDPVHQVNGQVRDLYVSQGRIVESLPRDEPIQTLDLTGDVVMPGGVEMHAHIASMPTQAARMIQSLAAWDAVVPTVTRTGELYASLGYTTAMEAAVPPGTADYAHLQLDAIPYLDTGLLTLMGNHESLVDLLAKAEQAKAVELIRQLLADSRGFGIKAVNPAGVSRWRRNPGDHHIDSIDDVVEGTCVSPRTMLQLFVEAQEVLNLSHPVHIHGPQLGEPCNVLITRDMIQSLSGSRAHLAHLQYYCYGHTSKKQVQSAVPALLNVLSDQPRITADLGLISFGPAFTATADLPLEYNLYQHTASPLKPAYFTETFNEDCFGVMPLQHEAKNAAHALQWAIGLELALLWDDPWRYALTVDHPNGGSFTQYPHLIACLMNKPLRDEQLAQCHKAATQLTGLSQITRELTLYEIAIITRAAPARALGLTRKGHLGVGADADIAVYPNHPADPQAMFEAPRYVIKAGQVIASGGSLAPSFTGKRLLAPTREKNQA